MADDDTWLDSFPVTRTDYPLPFDMELQAKPAYWGVVDPKHLPGYGLKFAISSITGDRAAKVITLTATNGNVGPAYTTQIASFTLKQVEGKHCSPKITPPSAFPISLGDIPTSGSASAAFTVDFEGCDSAARFTAVAPWSSATYDTGIFVSDHELSRVVGPQ